MKIVFVADAHIKGLRDPAQAGLAAFLDALTDIDKLVLLGDIFDFWAGSNPIAMREYRPLLDSLKGLSERGIEIIYVEGNHDFDMGSFFTKTLGASVFPDACTITLNGERIYLAHGDTVSMTTGYRLWRLFLRSPLFGLLTSVLPPDIVWEVAARLSSKSRGRYGEKKSLDKKMKAFSAGLIEGGHSGVILAHSHVAGVNRGITKEGRGFYANPGGWVNGKHFLLYEDGDLSVKSYAH